MERKHSMANTGLNKDKSKSKIISKGSGDCNNSGSTSHTQFFKNNPRRGLNERITTDEYFGISESISGSSDTYNCVHGPEGKQYTEKGRLKRNLIKELDPITIDRDRKESCPPAYGWDMAIKLEFLVKDPVGVKQIDRLDAHFHDFAKTSFFGYKVEVLNSLCTILDYLVEHYHREPILRTGLVLLLQNMDKPILLNSASDVVSHLDTLRNYFGFIAPNQFRGPSSVKMRHTLAAAAPVLNQTIVRMLAVANAHRFPTFLEIAFLLACDDTQNSLAMMEENILENIFYRFNPYFPERKLPVYDINPADPQDYNVKLGVSSLNLSTNLSLLMVLLKTTKELVNENPKYRLTLPCPDHYAQRCLTWAYRYECRARGHQHERLSLTVVVSTLLHCFGDRVMPLSTLLMPDLMSLSVLTELPPRLDWVRTVNFNTAQQDVLFKKMLIYLCVDFLKIFPCNKFMIETRHWLLGLMYLLDPALCHLRARWSPSLFAELRKTALQALVCTLHLAPTNLAKEYGLIRRLMWYIEWYSTSPYEISTLYWCVRLLQVAIYRRNSLTRRNALRDLFDTHGIIILINLCDTLLEQKTPPVERAQVVLAVTLRLLTSAATADERLVCCVYPHITWPTSVNTLSTIMLDAILFSLEKHFVISDRWMICLLNFIWEAVIWKDAYRQKFIVNDGIYKLLDLITMTRASVQCLALALVCDVARAGSAIGQLVSWRANLGAEHAHPNVVRRGGTIATLLAAIFRNECLSTGVSLDQYGIIQDLDCPLMSLDLCQEFRSPNFLGSQSQRTPICMPAGDMAGSRLSKAFALLHMLSEDLKNKVSLADQAYNLYKNIPLTPEDETILVLCAHYLTLKLNETWMEIQVQNDYLLPQDEEILQEFVNMGKGWAKEIKRQQEEVIQLDRNNEQEKERTLYTLLARVLLNTALDALRCVRCEARSADRATRLHAQLADAVRAHRRRIDAASRLGAPVLRTYDSPLDDEDVSGLYVKVHSINPADKPTSFNDDISS